VAEVLSESRMREICHAVASAGALYDYQAHPDNVERASWPSIWSLRLR
jgi:hypothetical protein